MAVEGAVGGDGGGGDGGGGDGGGGDGGGGDKGGGDGDRGILEKLERVLDLSRLKNCILRLLSKRARP